MSDYNGWTNYETWAVNLWMTNDQCSQEYFEQAAQEAWDHPMPNEYMPEHEDRARVTLINTLEAWADEQAEEWMPDRASFLSDLLNNALGRVNWYEIANSFLENVKKVGDCGICDGEHVLDEQDCRAHYPTKEIKQ